jgi:alpha-D-ribose 1-methylphosphonate 5-triphosphate synthase subunit PhnH
MKKAHDFDEVFDCQEVFRKLLEAFSNPGRAVDISNNAKKLNTTLGAYLAVAATLIDNETSYCVVGNEVLSELVQQFTYGQPQKLEQSGFVFIQADCDTDQIGSILSSVPAGTMEEPHKSGIVFVRVDSLQASPGHTIKGPGVKGELVAPFSAYAARWMRLRRAAAHEYPCGVDLAFITDSGQIMAAPRLVEMAG